MNANLSPTKIHLVEEITDAIESADLDEAQENPIQGQDAVFTIQPLE